MELSPDIEQNLSIDTNKLENQLMPLEPYTIHQTDEWWGFRMIVKNPVNKDLVAHYRITQVLDFSNMPEDMRQVVESVGGKIFMDSVGTDQKYRGHGVGTALTKLGILTLLAKEGEFLHEVQDASREKVDEIPWTTRNLPKILDSLSEMGIHSEIIWRGVVDNHDSFLVKYSNTHSASPKSK